MINLLKNTLKAKKRLLHINLDFLLTQFNLDIKSLSLQSGIPIATLVRMRKEDTNPTLSTIEPIADFFRIDLQELLYDDIASDEYQSKKRAGNVQYLRVSNLSETKQWPTHFESKIIVGTVGNLHNSAFGIYVDTESLNPIFSKNSILIIDPEIPAKDGDFVYATLDDDHIPVVRHYFVDGHNHFFKPVNPNYGGITMVKKFIIIGVIVKSIEQYR